MPFTSWIPAVAGMTEWCACTLLVAALGFVAPASAEEWQLGGHAKYQFTYTDFRADDLGAVFGENPARDHGLDLRLKAERQTGAWDVAVHYELLGVSGDSVATRRRLAALGLLSVGTASGLPDDRQRLFDLTHQITDDARTVVVHRLDRLVLGYRSDGQVLRFGRQVVSWGNGLVFHPLDFVNPFSPVAIDKDYKTGDDMLYGQWAFARGSDAQAIIVPRRDAVTRDVDSEQSTYAAKWRQRLGEFDIDLLGARHVDEGIAGVGLVRSLGGAVWRLDASYTDLRDGNGAWSWVTNIDYSWGLAGRNAYGYVEYFRNGVGESDAANYATPNAALSGRIGRGELFTLARDYAAVGVQIEVDPLVNVFVNLIRNLDDGSGFLQLRGVFDWRQDVQLMAGVNLPHGERGEEYGGVAVPGTGAYATPGRSAFVRLAYFF